MLALIGTLGGKLGMGKSGKGGSLGQGTKNMLRLPNKNFKVKHATRERNLVHNGFIGEERGLGAQLSCFKTSTQEEWIQRGERDRDVLGRPRGGARKGLEKGMKPVQDFYGSP